MNKPLKEIYITQYFGENPERYKSYGMKGHNGLDFRAKTNTPVFAAHDGKMQNKAGESGYGNHVILINKEYATCYAHLDRFAAVPHAKVKAGDLIGFTGNTGNSTGPHLHFGVRFLDSEGNIKDYENGYWGWQNPLPLLGEEQQNKKILERIFELSKIRSSKPEAALIIVPDDYGKVYLVKNGEKRLAANKDKVVEAILATMSVGVKKKDADKIPTGELI